jgi:hypothetical protein
MPDQTLSEPSTPAGTVDFTTQYEARVLIGGAGRPISLPTLYRGVAAGRYPRPARVGPNSVRWSREEVASCVTGMLRSRCPEHPAGNTCRHHAVSVRVDKLPARRR